MGRTEGTSPPGNGRKNPAADRSVSILLTIIAGVIMALILYTLTLDKLHSIALLKLIGAPNCRHTGVDPAAGILLGTIGYGIAYVLGQKIFPNFPRRVILTAKRLDAVGVHCFRYLGSGEHARDLEGHASSTQRGSVVEIESMTQPFAIETDRLTKIYGSGNTEVVAMRDASINVRRGEVVALLGPSGAGKSTFLTAVGLITPLTSGRVMIGGKLVLDGPMAQANLRAFRRKHIGYVFQKSNLIPFLTACENVQIALELSGNRSRASRVEGAGVARLSWRRGSRKQFAVVLSRRPATAGGRRPGPGQRAECDPGR